MKTPIPTTAQRRAVYRAAREIAARTDHRRMILLVSDDVSDRTAAAELLGKRLGADLYRVDLSAVVNKYIAETEKNLDRVFSAAEESGAVLLFDEGDALFGRRTEVKDSHDRYADMDVDYILQRAEDRGVTVIIGAGRSALDTRLPDRLKLILRLPRRRKPPINTHRD